MTARDEDVPLECVSARSAAVDAVRRRSVRCACDELVAMIDAMAPGDELRTFRRPAPDGVERGYAVLRGRRVVGAFVTARAPVAAG